MKSKSKTIGSLSKTGNHWGKNGSLARQRSHLADLKAGYDDRRADDYGAASSTYYSAAMNAVARASGGRRFWWLFAAIWCLFRARRFSDKMKSKAGGLGEVTFGGLHIRASICGQCARLWCWPFWWGSSREQLTCLEMLIDHIDTPSEIRELTRVQLAEILVQTEQDNLAKSYYRKARSVAPTLPPMTQVRIIRSMLRSAKRNPNFMTEESFQGLIREAEQLAKDNNLEDQLTKLKADVLS